MKAPLEDVVSDTGASSRSASSSESSQTHRTPRVTAVVPTPHDLYHRTRRSRSPRNGTAKVVPPSPLSYTSSSHTAPTEQLLEQDFNPLPVFRERSLELRGRIAEINELLANAGNGFHKRDEKIRLLMEEVDDLQRQLQMREHSAPGSSPPHVGSSPVVTINPSRERSNSTNVHERRYEWQASEPPPRGASRERKNEDQVDSRRSSPLWERLDGVQASMEVSHRKPNAAGMKRISAPVVKKPTISTQGEMQWALKMDRLVEALEHHASQWSSATHQRQQVLAYKKDMERYRKLHEAELTQLREEVLVLQCTVKRLLALLVQVPALKESVKDMDLLQDEMVCLDSTEKVFSSALLTPSRVPRPGAAGATGVDSGVVVGTVSSDDTKNIWLSGKWLQNALRDVIQRPCRDDFSSGERPPSPSARRLASPEWVTHRRRGRPSEAEGDDVLRARDMRKDYWVPLQVFKATQAFKNRYFPTMHIDLFFPYLQQLNRLWEDRLRKKLRRVRDQYEQELSQLIDATKAPLSANPTSRTVVESARQQSYAAALPSTKHPLNRWNAAPDEDVVEESPPSWITTQLYNAGGRKEEESMEQHRLWVETQKTVAALRRHVRLHITSPVALQVGQQYDDVVQVLMELLSYQFAARNGGNHFAKEQVTEEQGKRRSSAKKRNEASRDSASSRMVPASAQRHLNTFPPPDSCRSLFVDGSSDEEAGFGKPSRNPRAQSRSQEKAMASRRLEGQLYPTPQSVVKHSYSEVDAMECHLLGVIKQICDQMNDLGSATKERVAASTRDLSRLLTSLRESVLKQQQDERTVLRTEKYEGVEPDQASTSKIAVGTPEPKGESENNSSAMLLQVIESVLDYSKVVLGDVKKAAADIRSIAKYAEKEAHRVD